MASLAATATQNLRADGLGYYDKKEMLRPRSGAFDMFKEDANFMGGIITPDMKAKALRSFGNTLQIPVLKYDSSVTISSSRNLTITADENESALATITFVTYAGGFIMYPARHFNNDVSWQADYNRKMLKLIYAFIKTFEDGALTILAADKNQITPDTLGKYTFASNILEIPYDEKDFIFGDMHPIFNSLDLNEMGLPLNFVGTGAIESLARIFQAQGPGNSVNQSFQFQDTNFYFTNRITNATGKMGTFYCAPKGTLGVLHRNEADAVLNHKTSDGKVWDIVQVPLIELPFDSYYYEGAVDGSSIDASTASFTRTKAQYFGWSIDLAFISAYKSDRATLASPIIKGQIASA